MIHTFARRCIGRPFPFFSALLMLLSIQPKIILAGVLYKAVYRCRPVNELVFSMIDIRRGPAIHIFARRRFSRPFSAEPAGEYSLAEQNVPRLTGVGGSVPSSAAGGADNSSVDCGRLRTPVKKALRGSSAPHAVVSTSS